MGLHDSPGSPNPTPLPKKRISPVSDESEGGPLINGEEKYAKIYKVLEFSFRLPSQYLVTHLVSSSSRIVDKDIHSLQAGLLEPHTVMRPHNAGHSVTLLLYSLDGCAAGSWSARLKVFQCTHRSVAMTSTTFRS